MKIYTINSPKFEHNNIEYDVETRMFLSLGEFDNYLKEKNPSYVYIHTITNVDMNNNLVHPCDGLDKVKTDINIIFIRFKMIK